MLAIGRRREKVWLAVTALTAVTLAAPAAAASAPQFTSDFNIEACTWSAWGQQNPYFSLRPGRQLVLEGEEDGATIRNEITMLRELELVSFTTAKGKPLSVLTRVMEERETEDGDLVEVSRNWVARCVETGNIFYFGEEVDIYEDGVIVDHHGAWRAGVDGAQPGVLMPGSFLLGARYYQEVAPDVALDRGENAKMGLTVAVPAGTFAGCVQVDETNPLSTNPKEVGVKKYCPGIGITVDETQQLISHGVVP